MFLVLFLCYNIDIALVVVKTVDLVILAQPLSMMSLRYVKDGFYLGSLTGNSFTIALRYNVPHNLLKHLYILCRNATAEDNIVDEAVQTLQRSGFINYFGMQRFGTAATPTHAIGK